jgi:hypothetical protein
VNALELGCVRAPDLGRAVHVEDADEDGLALADGDLLVLAAVAADDELAERDNVVLCRLANGCEWRSEAVVAQTSVAEDGWSMRVDLGWLFETGALTRRLSRTTASR